MESFQKCIDKLLDAVNMTRHYLAFFLVGALSFVLSLSRSTICVFTSLNDYLSIWQSDYLSICISVYLSVYLSACLSTYLSS